MIAFDEMTLDELRIELAERLPAHAVFDGWTETALAGAAAELGVPADRAALCFHGGAVDMIEAWFASIDRTMLRNLAELDLPAMKIRDRIRTALLLRLEAAWRHPDALRRALMILVQPQNFSRTGKAAWHSADAIWRAIGDTSVDSAWYTKRATLAALYTSVITAWMDDESEGFADTRAFLDRRIDDVMSFEKLKAKWKPDPDRHFSPTRFLGRLRYRMDN
jgi:ubiquinone biosynthesis protein COQ9